MSRFLRQPDDIEQRRSDPPGPAKQRHAASYDPVVGERTWNGQPWPHGTPRPGPSVYTSRYRTREPEWVEVATGDPETGEFSWKEDWRQLATGWLPLGDFLHARGIL